MSHWTFALELYPHVQKLLGWIQYFYQTRNSLWHHHHHQHHHLSLNQEGCWGTTDDFTSFLHFFPVLHCLLGLGELQACPFPDDASPLFLCLPCLLCPFTLPCKMVLARPDEREMWPYYCSLCLFMMVRRSSCGLIACWILAWTSSLVTWSLYEMRSILRST